MATILVICFHAVVAVESITLRKECPNDEVHKSCAFHEEYSCWQQADRMDRVRSLPKRLPYCQSGCYCKKGLVREFPGGTCISAGLCRNRKLREVLKKIITDY